MEDQKPKNPQPIKLSKYTTALIESLRSVKARTTPDDLSKITVSQTVSFFALVYEKVRNAVEYREEHQIPRAAMERIIKRRLALNPEGRGEGENLVRELLWARYFDNGSLGNKDAETIQLIFDKYVFLRKLILVGRDVNSRDYLNQFIIELLTAEVEETLNPTGTQKNANYTYFIYQVLRNKVKLEGITDQQKDAFFLAALEKTYRRSDKAYQRYHLFNIFYKNISQLTNDEIHTLAPKLPSIFEKIDQMIKNPFVDHLSRFIKKQLPPFLILFSIFQEKFDQIQAIVSDKNRLWEEVEITCRNKYQGLRSRLVSLAVRSFIYIFLTKMVFALILEYPLSNYIYGEINYESIIINTLFPPFFMLLIISFFRIPGDDNTQKIYNRIIDITDADKSFETSVAMVKKKPKEKKPFLIFGFTIFYTFTFFVTFSLIYRILTVINFNLISQIIFVFFVSVVTFFSYRIKQVLVEYTLSEKEGILTPISDFFFMPILSLGKFFSQEIARLNFFIFIFDFLIEAPFKFIFEIIEEWISFVRKRKEEIF
ncbi:hypothetical protein GYA28_00385 [Candidatus Roizmanbacteria bacterium]|jgi:hypothetical protein|nr:hypothetical protein [Candidatus Roizmanbacteria bacterium]